MDCLELAFTYCAHSRRRFDPVHTRRLPTSVFGSAYTSERSGGSCLPGSLHLRLQTDSSSRFHLLRSPSSQVTALNYGSRPWIGFLPHSLRKIKSVSVIQYRGFSINHSGRWI